MSKARILADLISDSQITASEITGLELNSIQQGDTVVEVSDTGSGGKVVVRVDGADNAEFNAGGIKVPSGTTAERDPAAVVGSLRYNTTTGFFETFTSSGWGAIATPPSITGVTPDNFNGEAGTTFTVNGAFFDSDTTAVFKGADGTEYAAATVTFVNSTQITLTNATNLLVANEPFKVKVTNGAGLSVESVATIDAGTVPAFTTAAGNLASTTQWDEAVSVTVNATDAENTISGYAVTEGNLPAGLSLNATTGAITGTSTEQATTTYTFTIGATDSAGNTNTRQFSIQIVNAAPVWSSPAEGSTEQLALNTPASLTLNAVDPEGNAVSYSTTSALPAGLSLSGNAIVGTPTTATTLPVTVTASDSLASSARSFFIQTLVPPPLYSFTQFTFTNAGITGRVGPSLSDLQNSYSETWSGNTAYLSQQYAGLQTWTVPDDGNYLFNVVGASAPTPGQTGTPSGSPAHLRGTLALTRGQKINILVAQMGTIATGNYESGGGGCSVVMDANTNFSGLSLSNIFFMAGGGAGSSNTGANGSLNATTNEQISINGAGRVGLGGQTLTSGGPYGGSAGGGFGSEGDGHVNNDGPIVGGQSLKQGFLGGYAASPPNGDGGFGGGGASRGANWAGGGGGGGYSGGNGGCSSNGPMVGGGSYINTARFVNYNFVGTANAGDHGYVSVVKVS